MTTYKEIDKAIEELESITELLEKFKHLKEEPGKPFNEVFDEFAQGKKIRRKSWDEKYYISGYLCGGKFITLSSSDLLSTDWEVIE